MKGYRFFKYGFFTLLAVLLATVWLNYDYWAFKLLIANNYIFTDALDTVYTEALGEEHFKGYYRDFDRMVVSVVTRRIREVNGDRYTYLYNPSSYTTSLETEREDAKQAYIEPLSAAAVYIYIPNISGGTRSFFLDNKDELARYEYLVLDLRGNYGGLLAHAYDMAELFVGKGAVVGHEQYRSQLLTHAVKSGREPYFRFKKVIILQNERTASAAEGLILALKAYLPDAVTLAATDTPTVGKGIGQVTIPMTGGYAMRATVMLLAGPDGASIHGKGIAPDFVSGDTDILQYALSLCE
jgi:C-terminal processing protease CtpA/Prc